MGEKNERSFQNRRLGLEPRNSKYGWKRKWRDEFLKSLCGFANAQGGALEIGREDGSTIAGVDSAYAQLEELPNIIHQEGEPAMDICNKAILLCAHN
jgi:predicted HTH transcriptional regulator